MSIFKELFIWWSGNTISTRFSMWKAKAQYVGEDELKNRYFRAAELYKGQGERRWVIYHGDAEGSKVPAGWNGWLHHTVDVPPSEEDYQAKAWMLPHLPNQTGTAQAYRPAGSSLSANAGEAQKPEYQPWTPN